MSGEELRAATQELVDDIDAGRMFMNKVLRLRAALAATSTPEPSGPPPDGSDAPTHGAWPDTFKAGYAWGLRMADALRAAPSTEPALDVEPEVRAWFHEGEEICDHDLVPWPCELSAAALLRAFTVEPRLYERDGMFGFESKHFHRLELAARLAESQP